MFFNSYALSVLLGMVALLVLIWYQVKNPRPFNVVLRRAFAVIYFSALFGACFLPWPKHDGLPLAFKDILERADFMPIIPVIDDGIETWHKLQFGYDPALLDYLSDILPYFISLMPMAFILRREIIELHSAWIWLMTIGISFFIEALQLLLDQLSGVYYKHVSINHFLLASLGAGLLLLVMSGIRAIYLKQKGYSLIRNPKRELERLRERVKGGERRGKLITKDTHWR